MTDIDKFRIKQIQIVWMIICSCLLVFILMLIITVNHLRDELAKPVRLTYAEKMKIVQDYLADGETRFALRQQIRCTDKE